MPETHVTRNHWKVGVPEEEVAIYFVEIWE